MNSKISLGKHFIFDGFTSDIRLDSYEGLYKFLNHLTCTVDMNAICPPMVVPFPYSHDLFLRTLKDYKGNIISEDQYNNIVNHRRQCQMESSGFTGSVILMESHLSIHTFPEIKNNDNTGFMVSLDLYSCKEFDENLLLNLLKDEYKFNDQNYVVINRGFPIKKDDINIITK